MGAAHSTRRPRGSRSPPEASQAAVVPPGSSAAFWPAPRPNCQFHPQLRRRDVPCSAWPSHLGNRCMWMQELCTPSDALATHAPAFRRDPLRPLACRRTYLDMSAHARVVVEGHHTAPVSGPYMYCPPAGMRKPCCPPWCLPKAKTAKPQVSCFNRQRSARQGDAAARSSH